MSTQTAETTPPAIQISVDQWSEFANAMASSTADGPTTWSARHLLNHANSILPFSSATSILDIGCGTGKVMQVLLTECNASIPDSITLTASDIAPGMVEALSKYRAEQLRSGVPHWDKVQVKEMDARNLSSVADGSISHLTANHVYFLVPDYPTALQEAHRVLSPDGVFVESSWQDAEWGMIVQQIKKVRSDRVIPSPPIEWTSEEGVRKVLQKAGFKNVKTEKFLAYMPFEDHEEVVKFMFEVMPIFRDLVADFSLEEREMVYRSAIEMLTELHPERPGRMVGTGILGSGRK